MFTKPLKFLATGLTTLALVGGSALGQAQNTIVDVAVANGSFKTLVAAVKAAGLAETLSSPGPFTVFAPTDAAFAKLPKEQIELLLKDKEKLKGVLLGHVLAGSYNAAAVSKMHDGDKVKTASGKEFTLGLKNNVVTVNGSVVSKTDIQASNGVIHAIDTVILPK